MNRLLATVLALVLATPAVAQDGSFGSSPQAAPATTPTKPAPAARPTDDGGSTPIAPPKASPTTAPANLPSASEIFRRSVEAIGGEAAVRKHDSMHMKGTLEMPAAKMKGTLELHMLAPNRFLNVIEMGGVGRMSQGFDGTVGWSMNPLMGTQLLEGRSLEELRRSSDFYRELDPGKVWTSAKVVGVTDFAGKPCHEIAVEGEMGNGSLFYGVDDGLARGMRLTVESPMGMIPTTTRMLEYKPFDGLLLATRTEIEAMGTVQTMAIDSVDFGPVDPTLFELPAEVKALVANGKKSAPAKGAPGPTGRGRNGNQPPAAPGKQPPASGGKGQGTP